MSGLAAVVAVVKARHDGAGFAIRPRIKSPVIERMADSNGGEEDKPWNKSSQATFEGYGSHQSPKETSRKTDLAHSLTSCAQQEKQRIFRSLSGSCHEISEMSSPERRGPADV